MKIWTWSPLKPWLHPSAAVQILHPVVCSDETHKPSTEHSLWIWVYWRLAWLICYRSVRSLQLVKPWRHVLLEILKIIYFIQIQFRCGPTQSQCAFTKTRLIYKWYLEVFALWHMSDNESAPPLQYCSKYTVVLCISSSTPVTTVMHFKNTIIFSHHSLSSRSTIF